MTHPVVICERLASLARSGYPVRVALEKLPERLGTVDGGLAAVARRARLGGTIDACLTPLASRFGDAFPRLQACLSASSTSGSNWALALEELARSIESRKAAERAATLSAAGATLSARIVAGLPLLMLPISLRQIEDPVVATSILLGVLLGTVGYRWLMRTIPSAPVDDLDPIVAEEVAASVRAGSSLHDALTEAVARRPQLRRAFRRARLGSSWASALRAELPALASLLRDLERTGLPVVEALCRGAASFRAEANHRFDKSVQRAPVKMVVPLVCCVLPSFVLVAIVPLLRGLAHPV